MVRFSSPLGIDISSKLNDWLRPYSTSKACQDAKYHSSVNNTDLSCLSIWLWITSQARFLSTIYIPSASLTSAKITVISDKMCWRVLMATSVLSCSADVITESIIDEATEWCIRDTFVDGRGDEITYELTQVIQTQVWQTITSRKEVRLEETEATWTRVSRKERWFHGLPTPGRQYSLRD